MSEQLATSATRLDRAPELPLWVHGTAVGARRQRDATWALMRASCDALALAAAGAIVESAPSTLGPVWHAATLLVCLAAFASTGTYLPRMRMAMTDELRRVLSASALVFAAVGAIVVLGTDRVGAGDTLLIHWLVAATLLCSGRLGVAGVRRFSQSRWDTGGRTLVVGAGQVGHLTAKRLLDEPGIGLRPVGFLDKDPLLDEDARRLQGFPELPVMGASWDLERVVNEQGIDNVVVAFSTAPHHVMLDIVRRCWKLDVGVLVVPRLYEVEGRRMQVEHLGALPLVRLHTSDPSGWQMSVKYMLDRAVAALALLGLAPLLAVLALAVVVSTGRPVFFRQRRVGRDGHGFDMLKFRTMRGAPVENGEADAAWASLIAGGATGEPSAVADGDRRTPVGALLRRLSLDELPQLWNVLRGDMSLVGPRPERVHYVERFENVVYRYPDRHRVKSGLTGWAQVNGLRGETSLGDRIEWDNFYIENWSPWLDLKILVRTIPALIGRGGS